MDTAHCAIRGQNSGFRKATWEEFTAVAAFHLKSVMNALPRMPRNDTTRGWTCQANLQTLALDKTHGFGEVELRKSLVTLTREDPGSHYLERSGAKET